MKEKWKLNGRWRSLTVSACTVALFCIVLTHLGAVFSAAGKVLDFFLPVIVGAVIAYILNPPARWLRRTVFCRIRSEKTADRLSVLVTIILVIIILALLVGMLIPQLINSILKFVNNIDAYVVSLQRFIRTLDIPSESLEEKLEELVSGSNSALNRIAGMITDNIGNIIQTVTSVGSSAVNTVISFILAIYLLLDKNRIVRGFRKLFSLLLPSAAYDRTLAVWQKFNVVFSRYIVYDVLDGLIVGAANYIFMQIMGMPYALLTSAVVGVTNLAPTFGPIVGAAIGALILLLTDPIQVLWFLLFTIILQAIDGYILKPKMFGDALNVPAVLILASIIVGGRMFGVVGILLAIPVAALLEYLYHELFLPWLEKRRRAKDAAAAPSPADTKPEPEPEKAPAEKT